MWKATYGDLVGRKSTQDSRSCFDGGSGGQYPRHMCASIPRQRQKLAQINNSAGSQIQFAISLRAITIKFIDCNQSNLEYKLKAFKSYHFKHLHQPKVEEKLYYLAKVDQGTKVFSQRSFSQVLSGRQLNGDCWCFAVAPLAGKMGAPAQLAGRRCPKVPVSAQVPALKKQAQVPEVRVMHHPSGLRNFKFFGFQFFETLRILLGSFVLILRLVPSTLNPSGLQKSRGKRSRVS